MLTGAASFISLGCFIQQVEKLKVDDSRARRLRHRLLAVAMQLIHAVAEVSNFDPFSVLASCFRGDTINFQNASMHGYFSFITVAGKTNEKSTGDWAVPH